MKIKGNKTKSMKKFVLILIIILFYSNVSSHPHVFINSRVTFVFTKDEFKGIRINWTFDKIFSNAIKNDYDKDKDGRFNKNEIKILEDEAFSNLKNFNYFSHVHINGREKKINRINDFNASINRKSLVVYTFFIPLNFQKRTKPQSLTFAGYDHTYYASVNYSKKQPVIVRGLPKNYFSYRIKIAKDKAYYYGQATFKEIHLKFWE